MRDTHQTVARAHCTVAAAASRTRGVCDSRSHPLLQRDVVHTLFRHLSPVPHLCRAAQVCTLWAQVAAAPSLWRRVVVPRALARRHTARKTRRSRTSRRDARARALVRAVVRRTGGNVHTLLLDGLFAMRGRESVDGVDDADLRLVASRCAHFLQRFAVSECNRVSADGYLLLCEKCPNLRQLHIVRCANLQSSHLATIADACPLLEDISLRHCAQISGRSLPKNLAALSNTLQRFQVSNLSVSSLPLAPFALDFPSLRHLIIENDPHLQVTAIPPRLRHNVAVIFPSLRTLHVHRVSVFHPSWLQQILRSCTQLTALQASALDCHINSSHLHVQLPPLQRLCFTDHDIHDNTWHHIVAQLSNTLQYCDLSRNKRLTCSLPSHRHRTSPLFPKLHSLYLSETAVTDQTVKDILRLAPNLKAFNTDACRGVKDRAFRRNPLALSNTALAPTASQKPTAI